MATSVNVSLANLQKPSTQKSLKAKLRARLHFVVAFVGLGVVAAVGTYIAKKGLPDIDPVKVRARAMMKERRILSRALSVGSFQKRGTPRTTRAAGPVVAGKFLEYFYFAQFLVLFPPPPRKTTALSHSRSFLALKTHSVSPDSRSHR